MKKLFLIIGLSLPLLAQQTETDKEITKQEQREVAVPVEVTTSSLISTQSSNASIAFL